MLRYLKEEMVLDCKPKNNHIMVVDVNCQGILELDMVGRRFKAEFPETAAKYKHACLTGKMDTPKLFVSAEREHNIILISTCYFRLSPFKDSDETIVKNMEAIITKLEHILKEDDQIYSGILNRYSASWKDVETLIRNSSLNWTVLTD